MSKLLGGLLTVAGSSIAGGAAGELEELKAKAEEEKMKRLAELNDLYAQKREGRASLLEETKYGRRKEVEGEEKAAAITAEETRYQRRIGEEETTYQRRKGEKEAAANKYVKTGKITDAEGNEDLYGLTKDGTVKIIKEGGKSVAATTATEKLKAAAVKEALKMKEELRSQEDINLWLKSNGLQEWEEYPTGEIKETGGVWGIGTTKTPVMGTRIKGAVDEGKAVDKTGETDLDRLLRESEKTTTKKKSPPILGPAEVKTEAPPETPIEQAKRQGEQNLITGLTDEGVEIQGTTKGGFQFGFSEKDGTVIKKGDGWHRPTALEFDDITLAMSGKGR